MSAGGWERRIRCRDASGRPREVVVSVRCGLLVMTVPPGEAALLAEDLVGELADALRSGAEVLGGQGGGS